MKNDALSLKLFDIFYPLTICKELKFDGHSLELRFIPSLDNAIDVLIAHEEELKSCGATNLENLCPYFGSIWPSAIGLMNSLKALKIDAQAKILEIGAGLALPSFYLEKKGFRNLVAMDNFPSSLEFFDRNKNLNNISHVAFFPYSWKEEHEIFQHPYDLIIGSDILYEKSFCTDLLEFLKKTLNPNNLAIIADPGRYYLDDFIELLKKNGFSTELSKETIDRELFPVSRHDQKYEISLIKIKKIS